jgi:hypothetical protein
LRLGGRDLFVIISTQVKHTVYHQTDQLLSFGDAEFLCLFEGGLCRDNEIPEVRAGGVDLLLRSARDLLRMELREGEDIGRLVLLAVLPIENPNTGIIG